MLHTVFTNGAVSLTKDLLFGLSILSEGGWVALELCDDETIRRVVKLVDNNPTFPFKAELAEVVRKMENGELDTVIPDSMTGGGYIRD